MVGRDEGEGVCVGGGDGEGGEYLNYESVSPAEKSLVLSAASISACL